jgi:GT2 family glycosyltransferase/tetratricopeptide (TPR) repeat protein
MLKTLTGKLNASRRQMAYAARTRGDRARDLREWSAAGDSYEAYLKAFPKDFGVWVQLGHMRKDAGAFQAAEQAYGRALRLRANDADLLLNLGHLSKLQGKPEQAAAHYVASLRLMPEGPALAELCGGWLAPDVRDSVLERLEKNDPAAGKAIQRVTRGAKVRSARGLHLAGTGDHLIFSLDPQVVLEFDRAVREAPVAVIEIDYELIGNFGSKAGVLFLDLGQGYRAEDAIPIRYPGTKGRLVMFLSAPAALRAVRWDPTEEIEGGLILRSLEIKGYTDLAALVARANADDVIWVYDDNRISPEDMRRGLGALFLGRSLDVDDHRAMQAFLPTSHDRGRDYAHWRYRYANPGVEEYGRMEAMVSLMAWRPKFSFVMPVYNTDPDLLCAVLDAMLGQNYPDFEICVADDCSKSPEVARILTQYAARDERLKWVRRPLNGHISAASNTAMALASGDFVVLVDHDDLIPPYALFVAASYLNRFPDAKILFSDEDKISLSGQYIDPYFKSVYNQFLMFGHNMVSHLGIYDRHLLEDIGGFRMGLEGSQDYDLFLRASERIDPGQIVHIPHVLYHWRQVPGSTAISADQKDYAELAARTSINGHVERMGMPIQSTAGHAPGNSAITPRREYDTRVSIIIPTRNGLDLLQPCLDSIHACGTQNLEVIIANNDSDDAEILTFFEKAPSLYPGMSVRVVKTPGTFNFSTINNQAAAHATGEILCFLNNDTEVLAPRWVERARGLLAMDDVGAVGGKLLYPDGSVQHFGLVTGMYGHRVAGGVHLFLPGDAYGYFSKPCMIQEFSAVTAACLFVRKALFEQVGGFEADLAVAYNDVDLCLKLRREGKRILCDPAIRLTHKESKSRGSDATPERAARLDREAQKMHDRWGDLLAKDPFFSPNHSLDRPDFALAYPPRQKWPWEYGEREGETTLLHVVARAPSYVAHSMQPDHGFLAVCGIMKNEATNIVEWLAYHRAIGVEKFYLYDNNSTDHTRKLLQPLVERGVVDIIPWPINPGQLEAYNDFAERHRDHWTWAAFIDMDEFINPYGLESIPAWLAGFEGSSAIAVQWMNYGPNGHDAPPSGLLIEAYTKRLEAANPVHQHVKSLVRLRDYDRARSPHSFWVKGRIVDEFGDEIDQQAGDYAIMPIRSHTFVCLNHYYTRSRQEWVAKVTRGMADSASNAPNRRDLSWFDDYARQAEIHDDTITRFADKTRAVIAEWGYSTGPSLEGES